jgi:sensor histidine kinase YesM
MKQRLINFKSDYLGIISAGLCLIHCILLPILFAVQAIDFEHDVEGSFKWDYIFLIVSFYAVYHSAKHSHLVLIRTLFWATFSILSLCILLESISEIFEYLIILTSVGLVVLHLINLRYCQRCVSPIKHQYFVK